MVMAWELRAPMPRNANESFASRIATLRQQNALTASDLAKLADVTPAAVWNWEKNGTTPRQSTLETLASKLGVTSHFLLTGERSPLPPTHSAVNEDPRISDALDVASLEDLVRAIEAKGFEVTIKSLG
jgi:transcriptional regulator with XRE-family HTH domain